MTPKSTSRKTPYRPQMWIRPSINHGFVLLTTRRPGDDAPSEVDVEVAVCLACTAMICLVIGLL